MARRRRGMFGSSRSAAQYSVEQETLDGATSQGARRDGERRERSVGTPPHRESVTPPTDEAAVRTVDRRAIVGHALPLHHRGEQRHQRVMLQRPNCWSLRS